MSAPILSEDLRGAIESRALADVLAERMRQIEQFSHSPATDGAQPVHRLPQLAADYARIASDRAQPGNRQDLRGARKKAVQAAALALAAIDRIDTEERWRTDAAEAAQACEAMFPDHPALFEGGPDAHH